MLETPVGRGVIGVCCGVLVGLPGYLLGIWWGIVIAVGCLAFVAGWAAARRYWRKNGFVPKL